MDVYGVGIFITGESGVGKSENELELVKRGHRFVADDVVEIRKLSDDKLIGRSPDIIRHMMEIRGIGIIDVSVLYGMGAVRVEKQIDIADKWIGRYSTTQEMAGFALSLCAVDEEMLRWYKAPAETILKF